MKKHFARRISKLSDNGKETIVVEVGRFLGGGRELASALEGTQCG